MTSSEDDTRPRPLRLWPGILLVGLQWLTRFVVPRIWPDTLLYAVMSEFVFALGIVIWWSFFSRAPKLERWIALPLVLALGFATSLDIDKSIANGMMGLMFTLYSIPLVCLAFVAWAVVSQGLSTNLRRVSMVAAILLGFLCMGLVRTGGLSGAASSDLAWRWSKTPEERLLADAANALPPPAPAAVAKAPDASAAEPATGDVRAPNAGSAVPAPDAAAASTPAPDSVDPTHDWPGFRGPSRNGIVPGTTRIDTNWTTTPPVQLWKHPVGPGWSSFAVHGNLIYTQEQRGADEIVTCYNLTTGKPVWVHRDAARFWESNAGAGPRATPTVSQGRVFSFGATGILNALDARTGALLWTRNPATDAHAKVPGWGFASSPLVIDGMVIIATPGTLSAYDAATGKPRWKGPEGGAGYSSPQLATISGVEQILMMNGHGATGTAIADGAKLWEYPLSANTRIVQPGVTADGDVLASDGEAHGLRRIALTHSDAGWQAAERWTTMGLKPYFSDFVVHNGYAYGFDGAILSCIDLKDGVRKWKGGRYGSGQLIVLPEQNLLLVLSEEGELALVSATPDGFTEVAKAPGIEGKTWNHPVLVGNTLLVRNGEEMAAFRLPVPAAASPAH